MRSFIFILIAALFLGSAAYLGNMLFFRPTEAQSRVAEADVAAPAQYALRLRRAQLPGDILRPNLLEWSPRESEIARGPLLLRGSVELADLDGAVLLTARGGGEFLEEADILRPGDSGYEKALLRAGERAQALEIGNRSDYAALRVGDHVDLILKFAAPATSAKAGETLVRRLAENVRITALPESLAGKPPAKITLALPEESVARVLLGESIGRLVIAPYGYASGARRDAEAAEATLSVTDLFPELAKAPRPVRPPAPREVIIMRGGETSVEKFPTVHRAPPGRETEAGGY